MDVVFGFGPKTSLPLWAARPPALPGTWLAPTHRMHEVPTIIRVQWGGLSPPVPGPASPNLTQPSNRPPALWTVWAVWSEWSVWAVWSEWSVWAVWSEWSVWGVWSVE